MLQCLKRCLPILFFSLLFQLLQVVLYGQNSCAPSSWVNAVTQVTISGQCYNITNICPREVMIPNACSLNTASFEAFIDNSNCYNYLIRL